MKKIDAIIFDLDNTLYDFSSAWLYAHKEVFYYYKLDKYTNYEKFFQIFKKYNSEILQDIKNGKLRIRQLRNIRIQNTMNYFGYNFDDSDCKKFYENMFCYIYDYIKKDEELIKLLKKLKQTKKLFILTNGLHFEQYKKLDKLGIKNLFDNIYISSETYINKPDLRAFLNVLSNNKLRLENTLMIGDSLKYDIIPAYKLGLETCYIQKKWHLEDGDILDFTDYNYKCNNLLDFLKLM